MKLKLIIINSHMGAGKSTLTRSLVEVLPGNIFHLEIDKIKRMFGKYLENKSKNLQITYDIPGGIIEKCLQNEVTVIVDKAIGIGEIAVYENIAKKYNAETVKIFLQIDVQTQIDRINQRNLEKNTPQLTPAGKAKLKERFREFGIKESVGFDVIETTKLSPIEVLEKVREIFGY